MHPRIVDEDIQTAEIAGHGAQEAAGIRGAGHIQGIGLGRRRAQARAGGGHLLQLRQAPAGQGQPGSLARQFVGQGLAQAGRGARDQDHLVL